MLPWLAEPIRALDAELRDGRLGHAPMLLGPSGLGKRELGEWLVRRILCLDPKAAPCGRCRSCTLIEAGTHPDLFRLGVAADKNEIVVEQVREFSAALGLTPSLGLRRLGLIDPADRLNRNAANALLKTLEEPADEVWIVLITDHEDRLPITIRSRCQKRWLRVPERDAALAWLNREDLPGDEATRVLALELADGAPLLAARWLRDGEIQRAVELAGALAAVVDGHGDPARILALWAELSTAAGWAWLARLTHRWLRRQQGHPDAWLGERGQPRVADAAAILARCWTGALEGQRLAARPVRHDWLLQSWLADWRRLAEG